MTRDGMRRDAEAIFRAALDAASPRDAVMRMIRRQGDALTVAKREYWLNTFENVYVLGAGKASAAMAQAVETLVGPRIRAGLINVKDGHTAPLERIELNECGHPVPDARGEQGARRILEMAEKAGDRDLVVCVISGGASALLPLPAEGVTLEEKQAATRLLLACGATIHEINAVRKHISRVKGGQLSRAAYPATVLTLLLSDVIGDDLDVIGSGPTAPDRSTFADAKAILEKYGIFGKAPAAVRARIAAGVAGAVPETPKPGAKDLKKTFNVVVGSNRRALTACMNKARALGYRTMVLSSFVEGEAREAAKLHAAVAKEILAAKRPLVPPACVISGGETTVTIRGKGLGGRNLEFALAAAIELEGHGPAAILSGGTDGNDGPTDAAGAVCDDQTAANARELGLDPRKFLAENDSYRFFERAGGLVKTGPTNTNVMDVCVVLVGKG
jgi:hydroxypyruvate reductase